MAAELDAPSGAWTAPACSNGDSRVPAKLASETVIIESPMSFTGSAKRVWKLTRANENAPLRALVLVPVAVLLVSVVWLIVLCWNLVAWTILFFPTVFWRLFRRHSRATKIQQAQHREVLQMMYQQSRK